MAQKTRAHSLKNLEEAQIQTYMNTNTKKNDQNAYLFGIERHTYSITLFYIQIFSPNNLARSSRVLSSSGKCHEAKKISTIVIKNMSKEVAMAV